MTIHILSAGSFRAALSDLAAAWQGETITSRGGSARRWPITSTAWWRGRTLSASS